MIKKKTGKFWSFLDFEGVDQAERSDSQDTVTQQQMCAAITTTGVFLMLPNLFTFWPRAIDFRDRLIMWEFDKKSFKWIFSLRLLLCVCTYPFFVGLIGGHRCLFCVIFAPTRRVFSPRFQLYWLKRLNYFSHNTLMMSEIIQPEVTKKQKDIRNREKTEKHRSV